MVDFVVTFSKWSFSAVSKQFPMKFKYVSDPWLYFRFLYSKVVYFCYNGSIFNDYLVPQFEKSIKKNTGFFWEKLSGHQYRFKISLRIEWDHSQPLKITLKHSNLHPKENTFGLTTLRFSKRYNGFGCKRGIHCSSARQGFANGNIQVHLSKH